MIQPQEESFLLQQLKETEDRLEISLLCAEQVWWEWDLPQGRLQTHYADKCILGFTHDTLQQTEDFWWSRTHEDDIEKLKTAIQEHISRNTEYWVCEHRYLDARGQWKWVLQAGRVVEWENGNAPSRMIGITQLIDERKQRELHLEAKEREIREIINAIPTPCYVTDENHRILYYNREWKKTLCFDASATTCHSAVYGRSQPCLHCPWGQLSPSNPISYEITNPINRRTYRVKNTAVKAYEDRFHKITVLEDITREQKREHLLKQERDNAYLANANKSGLLAMMNHDLRSPLSTILLGIDSLDLCEKKHRNDLIDKIIPIMRNSCTVLEDLIDDIRDFSRLEANQLELNIEPINLKDFFHDIFSQYELLSSEKNLDLVLITDDMPERILNDAKRLRQIINNLLGNALKFTQEGRVTVNITTEGSRIIFTVMDTGIGIKPEELEHIFEPFKQANKTIQRTYAGTGLGLNICKRLSTLMSGSISVHSEFGNGTQFSVNLPLEVKAV